jgi:hypothetical protein
MKTFIVCAVLALIGIHVSAQNLSDRPNSKILDSVRFAHYQMAALKYPTIRQASISTDFISSANVHSKLRGNESFDGKAQFTRLRAHFTVPVASWGKNSISSTFGVVNERINLSNVTNHGSLLNVGNMKTNFTTFNFIGTYTRSDSLFNRPVTFGVVVNAMTNASLNRIRIAPTAFASLNLIRTPETSLSLGAVLIGDRSSVVPAYLLVSYAHKFSNLGVELLADLPQRIIIRKELSRKSFVSVGSEMGGTLFFFNLKDPGLPSSAVSTTLLIKSGVTFEHLVRKNVVLGVSAGIMSSPMIKALEKNGNSSDYFMKSKTSNAPYVNFSISFLPFWKGLKF